MAAFATPAELASFLQRDLDTATATLALENASQQIRDYVGWSVSEEVDREVTLDGTGGPYLWLPTKHLTDVSTVVENGVTLTVVDDFDWSSRGYLIRSGRWTCRPRAVVVTFTHGWPDGSEKLRTARSVCLSLAGSIYDNPGGVRSYTVDDVSETYAGASADLGPLLSDVQRIALDAYVTVGVS